MSNLQVRFFYFLILLFPFSVDFSIFQAPFLELSSSVFLFSQASPSSQSSLPVPTSSSSPTALPQDPSLSLKLENTPTLPSSGNALVVSPQAPILHRALDKALRKEFGIYRTQALSQDSFKRDGVSRLILSKKKLVSLQGLSFFIFPEISTLILDHNPLLSLSELNELRSFPQLTTLSLRFNQFTSFPVLPLPSLKSLYLSSNLLSSLPSEPFFSVFPQLTSLDLRFNRFQHFSLFSSDPQKTTAPAPSERVVPPSGSAANPSVTPLSSPLSPASASAPLLYLSLGGNIIQEISLALPSLKILSLENNRLERLPSDFCTLLPSLTHLFLHGNQFSSLEDLPSSCLNQLEQLSLHDNPLPEVALEFVQKLPQLQALSISPGMMSEEHITQLRARFIQVKVLSSEKKKRF